MSQKKPKLDLNDLGEFAGKTHNPVTVLESKKSGTTKSRIGKVALQGWFDKEVRVKFKRLAVDKDVTQDALFVEAIEDLFKKYGVK